MIPSLACRTVLSLVVGVYAALSPATPASGQLPTQYRFVDLGDVTGSVESSAAAVNAHGQVLISDISRTGYRTFLWKPGEKAGDLGTVNEIRLANPHAYLALDLNDHGQVLFHCRLRTPIDGGPVLWTPTAPNGSDGTLTVLQPPTAKMRMSTEAILTAHGTVLSECWDDKLQRWVAVQWIPEKPNSATMRNGAVGLVLRDRATGEPFGTPVDSNRDGWVIHGRWVNQTERSLWRPSATDPTIGTSHRVAPTDDAALSGFNTVAMNDQGWIVAGSRPGRFWAFKIDAALSTVETHQIKPIPPKGLLDPKRINDSGVVIGLIEALAGSFVWTASTGARDLAEMVKDGPGAEWRLLASDVNEHGWIVGMALSRGPVGANGVPTQKRRAFLLVPDDKN